MGQRIRHVLFDADGVLQTLPGGWLAALTPYVGERAESFVAALDVDELPCMVGETDFLPLLAARLEEYAVPVGAEDLFRDVWLRIHVDPASIGVVESMRARGLGVHLATNQEARRAAHMLGELGFADLFDECFVSAHLGAAKPSPSFFEQALEVLDADPEAVLFVDDLAENVAGARTVGLHAVQWHLRDGHEVLATRLSAFGLDGRHFGA